MYLKKYGRKPQILLFWWIDELKESEFLELVIVFYILALQISICFYSVLIKFEKNFEIQYALALKTQKFERKE